jgi:putative glycosyltransferase
MKLSIVATLYHSAPYIPEFYQRICAAATQIVGDDFELVLVNDGSPDHSLTVAVELCQQDSRVTVVDLSRNFGHHKAMMGFPMRAVSTSFCSTATSKKNLSGW